MPLIIFSVCLHICINMSHIFQVLETLFSNKTLDPCQYILLDVNISFPHITEKA